MTLRILASGITDLRVLEQDLRERNVDFLVERDSMADAASRQRFREMCAAYDWHSLPMVFDGEAFIGGELELRARLDACAGIDRVSLILTLAGLLPFAAGALSAWRDPASLWLAIMPIYGWLILSFMAGTFWGLGERLPVVRLASVVFPLLAIPGFLFLAPVAGTLVLAMAFCGLLGVDAYLLRSGRISLPWWRLRLGVTSAVILCLCAVLLRHLS